MRRAINGVVRRQVQAYNRADACGGLRSRIAARRQPRKRLRVQIGLQRFQRQGVVEDLRIAAAGQDKRARAGRGNPQIILRGRVRALRKHQGRGGRARRKRRAARKETARRVASALKSSFIDSLSLIRALRGFASLRSSAVAAMQWPKMSFALRQPGVNACQNRRRRKGLLENIGGDGDRRVYFEFASGNAGDAVARANGVARRVKNVFDGSGVTTFRRINGDGGLQRVVILQVFARAEIRPGRRSLPAAKSPLEFRLTLWRPFPTGEYNVLVGP